MYLANWKMYWTFDQTIEFVNKHFHSLTLLAQSDREQIILCPSFVSLYPIAQMFAQTNIAVGAQDCCDHARGAFTGQISAPDLKALGCQFCIIGHSERRRYNGETDTIIALKCAQLLDAGISPVICIGETQEENQRGKTLEVLARQLSGIIDLFKEQAHQLAGKQILIAYEPVWAIGTGLVPTHDHLETVFAWLATTMIRLAPNLQVAFIYGGSITARNSSSLKKVVGLDGFLIGGASLDFQEFENIIKCNLKD